MKRKMEKTISYKEIAETFMEKVRESHLIRFTFEQAKSTFSNAKESQIRKILDILTAVKILFKDGTTWIVNDYVVDCIEGKMDFIPIDSSEDTSETISIPDEESEDSDYTPTTKNSTWRHSSRASTR